MAASYAKAIEDKSYSNEGNRRNNKFQGRQGKGEDRNPHFVHKQGQAKTQEDNLWPKRRDSEIKDQNKVQPRPVDGQI